MNAEQISRERRKRRQQRRLMIIGGFLLFSIGMAWFFESQATTTVIVTRYADKSLNSGADPGLSSMGQRRALELARLLGEVDVVAGVDAIFITPNRRSRDTSVPLAIKTEAPVHTVDDPEDVEGLVQRIITEFKGKIVLIITDPEYMQPVIAEMHGSKKLPDMADDEYDNIYIVSIPWFGKVKTLRLRWGVPYNDTL